jgi:hypothetical protein
MFIEANISICYVRGPEGASYVRRKYYRLYGALMTIICISVLLSVQTDILHLVPSIHASTVKIVFMYYTNVLDLNGSTAG